MGTLLTGLWHGGQSPPLEWRGSPLHQHLSSPGSDSVHLKKVSRYYKSLKFPFILDVSIVCFSPLDKAELFFILGDTDCYYSWIQATKCYREILIQQNLNFDTHQKFESICRHNIRLKPCNCTCLCTCARGTKDRNITCFSIRNLVSKFFF